MTMPVEKRLPVKTFHLDVDGLRQGKYSDDYFNNTADILTQLARKGYRFQGKSDLQDVDCSQLATGDGWVEMQFFTSRSRAVIAGVDEALAILQTCTGYYDDAGRFVNTFADLEVEAVQDGTLSRFQGDKRHVEPVLKVRGRYRDFARLETALLGALARPTRIATLALELCEAAGGKEVQFFPARFEHYRLQAWDGYAFHVGVQAYNRLYGAQVPVPVSTRAQGRFWGGQAGGTMPHALIAAFHGDTVEAMLQFCRHQPAEKRRVALVDFHNDCAAESVAVARALFTEWHRLTQAGDHEQAHRFKLFGVRPDTSGGLVDQGLQRLGKQLTGVNAALVRLLRESLDQAYLAWNLPPEAVDLARQWCQEIKIVVTGGFNARKIREFEAQGVPVDIYGVGSAFLVNDKETNCDFTADLVRTRVDGIWYDLAKVGRGPCDNPALEPFIPTAPAPKEEERLITIAERAAIERAYATEHGRKTLINSLSGGIDSSVSAMIAKEALPDGAIGLLLPCSAEEELKSEWLKDLTDGKRVADHLEIPAVTINLSGLWQQAVSLYTEAARAMAARSGLDLDEQKLTWAVNNLKPTLRMMTAGFFADAFDGLMMGTDNAIENFLGYFSIRGAGIADRQPIRDCTKAEVRALAASQGLPPDLIHRVPTAGLWPGQTDEGELGFTYAEADRFLLWLLNKHLQRPVLHPTLTVRPESVDDLLADPTLPVRPDVARRIIAQNQRTAFKRRPDDLEQLLGKRGLKA